MALPKIVIFILTILFMVVFLFFGIQSSVAYLKYMNAWKDQKRRSGEMFSYFAMMNNFSFGKLNDEFRLYKIQYWQALKRSALALIFYAAAVFVLKAVFRMGA